MPPSDSDLVAALAGLPPDTQRAAIKVLTEWGNSPLGAGSFPVRLALVVRLQLWALTRSATKLASERVAIADLVTGLTLALAREGEVRESFLRELRSEERGEAQRLLSLAQAIETQADGIFRRLAKFEQDINRANARSGSSPKPPRGTTSHGRQVLARMLRTVRRLEALEPSTRPIQPACSPPGIASAPSPVAPASMPLPVAPAPGPPSAVARPSSHRPAALAHWAAVFVAALAYAWVINPEPVHLPNALLRAVPAAVGLALFCTRCRAVAVPRRP